MTAISLTLMSVGIPAFMLSKVLSPAFFARQDTRTPMRAALLTVAANVLLTIAFTTPLWLYGVEGAHGGIALATALAGIFNAWLLWRYLHRAGLLLPQPGWGRFALRLVAACVVMAATVVALRLWIGPWTEIGLPTHRIFWLFAVIAAGALSYGATLLASGLRARDLRH
jgi:putative peptidoglycan lipid II flippase